MDRPGATSPAPGDPREDQLNRGEHSIAAISGSRPSRAVKSHVPLDVGPIGRERVEFVVGAPAQEDAQV